MIDIKGQLSIGEDGVLWFNDDQGKCRLRIYRLTTNQRARLKDGFVDIRL